MNRDETEFIIYIINEVANIKGISTSKVYKAINETDCINEYLVPFYDVLHTLSSENVANDVIEYVEKRGVVIW